MLKAKKAVNYRKGNKQTRCLFCVSFIQDYQCVGIGDANLGQQPRCKVIGLKPGRMYRVSSDYRCDSFQDKFQALP
jgi:hypothetical protein